MLQASRGSFAICGVGNDTLSEPYLSAHFSMTSVPIPTQHIQVLLQKRALLARVTLARGTINRNRATEQRITNVQYRRQRIGRQFGRQYTSVVDPDSEFDLPDVNALIVDEALLAEHETPIGHDVVAYCHSNPVPDEVFLMDEIKITNSPAFSKMMHLTNKPLFDKSSDQQRRLYLLTIFWQPPRADASMKIGMLCYVISHDSEVLGFKPFRRVMATSEFDTHPNGIRTVQIQELNDQPPTFEDKIQILAYNDKLAEDWRDEMIRLGRDKKINMDSLITRMRKNPDLTLRLLMRFVVDRRLQLHGKMGSDPAFVETLIVMLTSDSVLVRQQAIHRFFVTSAATLNAFEEIDRLAKSNLQDMNTRYVNMERQKVLKAKLGMEIDEKKRVRELIQGRLENLSPPEQVAKAIDDELAKIQNLEPQSSEFNVSRVYLDWLTQLPWGTYTKDNYDIAQAETILNDDHYGLEEIKEKILQIIAIAARKETTMGKIILLVGPPGVGKTSITESIARALGRSYFRISGAMSDPAELKGHRRTFIQAVPGRVIQGFKTAQSMNPVVAIDEVDKVGLSSHRGDPQAVLLELLDPEQNSTFLDHYLDLPFDVSKALFICTANSTDSIIPPLLDRMHVLRLSGYVPEEKTEILNRHIIPKLQKDTCITDVKISAPAQKVLVTQYSRESGVRNLQRFVERIYRKVAVKMASKSEKKKSFIITEKNLPEFCGLAPHESDPVYQTMPVGVVTGLAWTQVGGTVLMIETVEDKIGGLSELHTTGNLEPVMKESCQIAYTFAKQFISSLFPGNKFLQSASLHMHIPSGAVKKDGPSAGVTIVTSLVSLALNKPIKDKVAMTGEITLTGRVLRIGGVREKVMAAKQNGKTTVILPVENRADFEKLPEFIRNGVEIHYASHYSDVFKAAFAQPEDQLQPIPDVQLHHPSLVNTNVAKIL